MASVMVNESLPPLGLRVGGRFRVPTVKRPPSGGECASVVSITTAARDRVRRIRLVCAGLLAGATTAVLVGAPAMSQAGITFRALESRG